MTNNMNISFEETQDPSGIRCGPEHYQECSRDPMRTPFQWSADDKTAGFSVNASAHTWLPVNDDYMNGINVKVCNIFCFELNNKTAILTVYKALTF